MKDFSKDVLRIGKSGKLHDLGGGVLVMPRPEAGGGYNLSFESLGLHSQISFDAAGSLPAFLKKALSEDTKTMSLLQRLPDAREVQKPVAAGRDFIPYEEIR